MSKPRTISISDLVQEQQNERRARQLPSILKSTPIRSGPSSVSAGVISQGRGISASSSVNGVSRSSMAEAPPSSGSSVGASSLPRFPFSGIGRAAVTPNNSGSNTTVSASPYSSPAQHPPNTCSTGAVTRRSSSLDSMNTHHKGDTNTSKANLQHRSSPSPSSPLSRPSVSGSGGLSSSLSVRGATQTSVANGKVCVSSFAVFDTRTNKRIGVSGPAKWRGTSVNAKLLHSQTPEACVMKQSYQQFICLKVLLAESRRYAWSNIVLRHPEAAADEVLVFQFNSTWCQLVDDVTTAIVERHVPNVAAASAIVNMMELFQRHSPAVDLLPDCTPPIGPRHLPIDWYEAQRQEVRTAVVEERQARKGRAVAKAMCSLRPIESQMMRRL